jgi:hypothetical protein
MKFRIHHVDPAGEEGRGNACSVKIPETDSNFQISGMNEDFGVDQFDLGLVMDAYSRLSFQNDVPADKQFVKKSSAFTDLIIEEAENNTSGDEMFLK